MKYTVIRDGRGSTYVAPLAHPVRVGYAEDTPATHVVVWFNRDTRDWVVSYSDATGNQIGDSEYVYSRPEADESAANFIALAARTPVGQRVTY